MLLTPFEAPNSPSTTALKAMTILETSNKGGLPMNIRNNVHDEICHNVDINTLDNCISTNHEIPSDKFGDSLWVLVMDYSTSMDSHRLNQFWQTISFQLFM
jgi:hypothetical protein